MPSEGCQRERPESLDMPGNLPRHQTFSYRSLKLEKWIGSTLAIEAECYFPSEHVGYAVSQLVVASAQPFCVLL
jgi:hypothetical protein